MTSKEALEEVVKQFNENMNKAFDGVCQDQTGLFNVFSYDMFQLMKEKKCLDIFNGVDLYIEMKDGTFKKYNNKTGELDDK